VAAGAAESVALNRAKVLFAAITGLHRVSRSAYIGRMKPRRQRPARDKLVDVKIIPWERGEWGVREQYRDEQGDWFYCRPLREDKKPPAASVKRRRKVPA
jgi:hypothetical protein